MFIMQCTYIHAYVHTYCIAQNFDGGNIDGLASFRSLTGGNTDR